MPLLKNKYIRFFLICLMAVAVEALLSAPPESLSALFRLTGPLVLIVLILYWLSLLLLPTKDVDIRFLYYRIFVGGLTVVSMLYIISPEKVLSSIGSEQVWWPHRLDR